MHGYFWWYRHITLVQLIINWEQGNNLPWTCVIRPSLHLNLRIFCFPKAQLSPVPGCWASPVYSVFDCEDQRQVLWSRPSICHCSPVFAVPKPPPSLPLPSSTLYLSVTQVSSPALSHVYAFPNPACSLCRSAVAVHRGRVLVHPPAGHRGHPHVHRSLPLRQCHRWPQAQCLRCHIHCVVRWRFIHMMCRDKEKGAKWMRNSLFWHYEFLSSQLSFECLHPGPCSTENQSSSYMHCTCLIYFFLFL